VWDVEMIQLAQDMVQRFVLVNTVTDLQSGSTKSKEFLDQLSDYQFAKDDPSA
jgi:hypothetical protein